MNIVFKNQAQIKQYFNEIAKTAINSVSEKLLLDFQDHLNKTIYSPVKNTKYKRYKENGGFYSGWSIKDEEWKFLGDYVKSLVFDGKKLISPENDTRNGNIAHGGKGDTDIRNIMMRVLNDKIENDYLSINGGAKYVINNSIGYWDSYLDTLDAKIKKWFDEELGKYGFKRR